jgi:chromosome segregation ATPase
MPQETPREKELSEALARATAENARVSGELAELRTENKLLREKIEALIRRLFGAQSEKLDREQLLLMLQGLDERPKSPEPVEAEAPRRSTAASPPRERRQPRLPEHLPVVEEMIVPEAVKAAPQQWRRIGEEPKPAAAG